MGFVLRLNGVTPLHASSVDVDGKAVTIVGPPGAGKSTTAAAFAHLGHDVLSDDVAALHDTGERMEVAPGYPRVNLWPDSVRALHGSEDALPTITPTWAKRFLPLERASRFACQPLPLGAIYLLGRRDSNRQKTSFEQVAASEALVSLVGNAYVNYLLDREMRHRDFHVLSQIVATIPVRRVNPCGDCSRVIEVAEAIAADARSIMPALAGVTSGAE
jgi:hypothetical protein